DQIDGICIGEGGPSWWKFPRVYVRWKDTTGKPSVFSLATMEPCSIWQLSKQTTDLYARIAQLVPAAAVAKTSDPPGIREITSRSPREFGGLKANLTLMIFLLPLAAVINAAVGADALWYILGVVGLTRLVESVPFWRFRDRLLAFKNQQVAIATANND